MFSFTVTYGTQHSAVLGQEATLEKTLAARDHSIAYYRALGDDVTSARIQEICSGCEGTGQRRCKHTHHRRGIRPAQCVKPCKTCRGAGVFPVDLPAKWQADLS
jgi:DnaJ-class molecular chaperone